MPGRGHQDLSVDCGDRLDPQRLHRSASGFDGTFLTPVWDECLHWQGHSPRVTLRGTITTMTWASDRRGPGVAPAGILDLNSHATEYVVDEDARTVNRIWPLARKGKEGTGVTLAMGDVQVLEDTDNALIELSCSCPRDPVDMSWDKAVRSWRYTADVPKTARPGSSSLGRFRVPSFQPRPKHSGIPKPSSVPRSNQPRSATLPTPYVVNTGHHRAPRRRLDHSAVAKRRPATASAIGLSTKTPLLLRLFLLFSLFHLKAGLCVATEALGRWRKGGSG